MIIIIIQQQSSKNTFFMDFGIIQKLAKFIIRPPRSNYQLSEMGSAEIQYRNRTYQREDFVTINNRGLELRCSFIKDKFSPTARQTILFLHANSSNRLVVKNYMDIFLPYYDLASFDFAGCGQSQGQFITLGYNQREDVYSVIRLIRQKYGVKEVILWGRSMGAATAILYASKYRGIKAIISDNSFSDLSQLVNQLSDEYMPILPSFLINTVIDSIQDYIQQNIWKKQITNFDIKKLKPINVIEKIKCPIFYIGSQDDTFVNVRHTKGLYERTKGGKQLELVKGDHNDLRSDLVKEKVLQFLVNLNTRNSRAQSRERISIFKSIEKQRISSTINEPYMKKTSTLQQNYPINYKENKKLIKTPENMRSNILQEYFVSRLNRQNNRISTIGRRKRIFNSHPDYDYKYLPQKWQQQ